MSEVSADLLESLAAKIDALDLSDEEQAVLDSIFERAETGGEEVEGFAFSTTAYTGFVSGAELSSTALKLGGGLGFITRPSLGYDNVFDPDDPTKPPPP
jgi:hypothetical protein